MPQNAQRERRIFLKICQKNLKKPLDTHGRVLYDNGASERAQSAMMREIALKRGNFRGVCPTIGRLSEGCTRRISPGAAKTGLLCAGFFAAWSDTHESVYTNCSPTKEEQDP